MSPPPLFSPDDDWGEENDAGSGGLGPLPPHLKGSVAGHVFDQKQSRSESGGSVEEECYSVTTSGDPAPGRKASIPAYPPFGGLPDIPALATLKARRQWVAWKYVPKPGKWKPDKVPINPATGAYAKSDNPKTWGGYEAAAARARRDGLPGVGFMLAPDDGLCGIDLDSCRDPETGKLDPWAAEIVALAETYVEVSPSGRGLRLFALGKPAGAVKSDPAGVEIYGSGRFLTVTGRRP